MAVRKKFVLLSVLAVLLFTSPFAVSAYATAATCVPAGSTTLTTVMVVGSNAKVVGKNINASGCDMGIYVKPGSNNVLISGVVVTGANQHGILVQDSSHVTIVNSYLAGNGVASRVCPPSGAPPPGCIPENKPIELVGTSNSVVANNVVILNGADGGIGIADDGAQNPGAPLGVGGAAMIAVNVLVRGNTIIDNTKGCGVVVATYNNAVFGVRVIDNVIVGSAPGTGPFIGQIVVATDAPNTLISNIIIRGNILDGSVLPGIVLHANAPGDVIQNTIISSNILRNNGFYPGPPPGAPGYDPNVPGMTNGTTGISIVAESFGPIIPHATITNTLVRSNTVLSDRNGVWLCNTSHTTITGLKGNSARPIVTCPAGGS